MSGGGGGGGGSSGGASGWRWQSWWCWWNKPTVSTPYLSDKILIQVSPFL
jgi:hypothetical protein